MDYVQVLGVKSDVCSDADLRNLAQQVEAKYGKIDALVINAGYALLCIIKYNM